MSVFRPGLVSSMVAALICLIVGVVLFVLGLPEVAIGLFAAVMFNLGQAYACWWYRPQTLSAQFVDPDDYPHS